MRRFGERGFSLLEMLVCAAVFALLIVLIAQMVNSATLTILGSRKRIDSDAAVRSAMGIMANDFARIVQRPMGDVDFLFAKCGINDKVFFYSEAPGYISNDNAILASRQTVSLVGYRVNKETFQLERLGKGLVWSKLDGLTWDQAPWLVFLSFQGNTPAPQTTLAGAWPNTLGSSPEYNGSDNDYHAISEEIFRFEFCFIDQSGKCFQPSSSWQPWADDNNDGIANIKEVRAIVVALAALDKTSRQLVGDMSALAKALPDPSDAELQSSPPKLMAMTWKQAIESPDFAKNARIPKSAAGAVRVYQRVLSLNGK